MRQAELKGGAAAFGLVGAVTKSPTLVGISVGLGGLAGYDTFKTTGEVDFKEIAVTGIALAPGAAGLAAKMTEIHEAAEAVKGLQEGVHVGAAALSAEAAVIEVKVGSESEHAQQSAPTAARASGAAAQGSKTSAAPSANQVRTGSRVCGGKGISCAN